MKPLYEQIPDPDDLLALGVEDVAAVLLGLAKATRQNGTFHPANMTAATTGLGGYGSLRSPYERKASQVELAVAEAWNWLRVQGLVVQAPGQNGANGTLVVSRAGERIASETDFRRFRAAAAFPKSMLHTKIADKAWLDLARGDLSDAVFYAFRTVEEAVREAGCFALTDIGPQLMRKAFHVQTGPLTDMSQPEAEREALAHLFAGAMGSYKNPHSHRTVTIADPAEAQEMVLLASHLLKIVDARRPK